MVTACDAARCETRPASRAPGPGRGLRPSTSPGRPALPRRGARAGHAPTRDRPRHAPARGGGAPGRARRRAAGQTWVPLSAGVSRHLVHAVLASEDQKFFGHEGVDWEAIEKSVEEDRKKRPLRARRQHHHPAAGQEPLLHHAQEPRRASCASWWWRAGWSRTCQAAHPGAVPERHRVGRRRLRRARPRPGATTARPASALDADEAAGLAAMIPNPRRINPRVDPRAARARAAARAVADGARRLPEPAGRWARSRRAGARWTRTSRDDGRRARSRRPPEPEPSLRAAIRRDRWTRPTTGTGADTRPVRPALSP